MTDKTKPPVQDYAEWEDINSVPEPFRTINGSRASLDVINHVAKRAHERGEYSEGPDGKPLHFLADWGGARQELEKTHEAKDGVWVAKRGDS